MRREGGGTSQGGYWSDQLYVSVLCETMQGKHFYGCLQNMQLNFATDEDWIYEDIVYATSDN